MSWLLEETPPRGGLFGVGASRGGLGPSFSFSFALFSSALVGPSPGFIFFFGGALLGSFLSTLPDFCLSAW